LKLLSGPPSAFIFVEPRIQVNDIPDRAPAHLDRRRTDLKQERHADGEIRCGLLLGEAARMRKRQSRFLFHDGFRWHSMSVMFAAIFVFS